MVKQRTTLCDLVAIVLIVATASCGDSTAPTSPSALAVSTGAVAALSPDGVFSLKTSAPVPQSPITNAETVGLSPVLTIANSQPRYVEPADADFSYRFEVYLVQDGGMMVLVHANTAEQMTNTTSYTVNVELEQTKTYMWRARAKIGDENGPWSDAATFRTPTLVTVDAPTPLTPANGSTTSSVMPDLVVANGAVSANAGTVVYQYQLDDESAMFPNPSSFGVSRSTGTTTTAQFSDALATATQFWWRVRATNGTITSDWSATFSFTTPVTAIPAGAPPAPDPPPGGQLPLPNEAATIASLAVLFPAKLANSCQEDGGTWEFMDIALTTLRQKDGRWGYNCKRGNCADISLDVLDYHYGAGPAEGSTDVYIIDIIGGHCGPSPSPEWIDQTSATAASGDIGRWSSTR